MEPAKRPGGPAAGAGAGRANGFRYRGRRVRRQFVRYLAAQFAREFVAPDDAKLRAVSFLLGLWSVAGMRGLRAQGFRRPPLVAGAAPGGVARQTPAAAVLAGLGLGATVMLAVLTVLRTPGLRTELFGPAQSGPTLVINWEPGFVDRVVLERDGEVVADAGSPDYRLVPPVGLGVYTARGYRGGRVVYVESFTLGPAESKVVEMFAGVPGPDGGFLRVECDDRGLFVTATGAGHTFAFSHPGFQRLGRRAAAAGRGAVPAHHRPRGGRTAHRNHAAWPTARPACCTSRTSSARRSQSS